MLLCYTLYVNKRRTLYKTGKDTYMDYTKLTASHDVFNIDKLSDLEIDLLIPALEEEKARREKRSELIDEYRSKLNDFIVTLHDHSFILAHNRDEIGIDDFDIIDDE